MKGFGGSDEGCDCWRMGCLYEVGENDLLDLVWDWI